MKYSDISAMMSTIEPNIVDVESMAEIQESEPAQEFVDSGNFILNAQLSGSLFGGWPIGGVSTVSGDPKTGKSFLIYNAIVQFQKEGYYCILRDTEAAANISRIESMGVDVSSERFLLSFTETVEQMTNADVQLTDKLAEMQKKGQELPKIAIFVDSITALNSQKQYDDAGKGHTKTDMGTVAKANHAHMRLLTNRFKRFGIPVIGTAHTWYKPIAGMPHITRKTPSTQGTAWIFFSSVVIMLSKKTDKAKERSENEAGVMDKKVNGLIIRSDVHESRYCKHIPVNFYLSFIKGMNPYLGLQGFISWDICGIDKGSWKDTIDIGYEIMIKKAVKTPQELVGITVSQSTLQDMLAKAKYKLWASAVDRHLRRGELVSNNDGSWVITDKILENLEGETYPKPVDKMPVVNHNTNTYIARHLEGRSLTKIQLFTPEVFTQEVLQMLDDNVIRDHFRLPFDAEIEQLDEETTDDIFDI